MALDWEMITEEVAQGVRLLMPVGEELFPEASATIAIVSKLISGLAAAEPTAVALVKQIQSGTVPTQTELSQFYANYIADDNALNADIEAHLSQLK